LSNPTTRSEDKDEVDFGEFEALPDDEEEEKHNAPEDPSEVTEIRTDDR